MIAEDFSPSLPFFWESQSFKVATNHLKYMIKFVHCEQKCVTISLNTYFSL